MSQNPKKPVISELIDADLGLTLGETCDGDGIARGICGDPWEDFDLFLEEGLEDQCTECFGHGTIDHDDSGDEDPCHVCGGTGWLTYLP